MLVNHHTQTIKPSEYLLDLSVILKGAESLITKNSLGLTWKTQTERVEHDMTYEKQQTEICYNKDGKYDFEILGFEFSNCTSGCQSGSNLLCFYDYGVLI